MMVASSSLPRTPATFRRKKLEAGFIEYCQLSTKCGSYPLSPADLAELKLEAENFIASDEFSAADSERRILGDEFVTDCAPVAQARVSRRINLPPHLASLCEERLLSPEQERQLFQRMNYLRYRANQILVKASAQVPNQWDTERVQGLLRAARWYRDCLVRANVRLVISIVKKFVNQQCGFDDLLSDGIMALIRSVDKFDYQLGFRFSTYATQVVRRNSYRYVMDRQEERFRITNSISDSGLDVAEEMGGSSISEQRWKELRQHLSGLLGKLEKRERFIVRARFSLGGHRRVQTLQKLADRLGISKERVRQLEKRALDKLLNWAGQNPPVFSEVDC
jgi:RNA polymerase primary sigma factor